MLSVGPGLLLVEPASSIIGPMNWIISVLGKPLSSYFRQQLFCSGTRGDCCTLPQEIWVCLYLVQKYRLVLCSRFCLTQILVSKQKWFIQYLETKTCAEWETHTTDINGQLFVNQHVEERCRGFYGALHWCGRADQMRPASDQTATELLRLNNSVDQARLEVVSFSTYSR